MACNIITRLGMLLKVLSYCVEPSVYGLGPLVHQEIQTHTHLLFTKEGNSVALQHVEFESDGSMRERISIEGQEVVNMIL